MNENNSLAKESQKDDFVHLHVHTSYSLLDGLNKVKDYVKKLKSLGMSAGAITDHGVMFGVVEFVKLCKENDIKPIIGCEVYVAPNSRFDREVGTGDEKYHHLVLLAENNQGYSNLCKIVSIGFKEGFYSKPRVDFEILEKYHEGIIALSACLAGEIPYTIRKGNLSLAREIALKYKNCFGENNFFLELQDHGMQEQKLVNFELFKMSQELGIDLVATNDVHYTNVEDAIAHDVLLCVQTGKMVSDPNRMKYEGGQFYVKSGEEMSALFKYAPQAITNTKKIADRCNVTLEFGVTKMPKVQVPNGYTPWTYLNEICMKGIKERYPNNYEEHLPQLEYELKTIKDMGFVEYFIIVWDFINWAKEHDIPVGPGRGSAAGSLVAYTSKITNIDPIKLNLVFERFLNPERVSMPDIDVDICYERRWEVIKYVQEKYGIDNVTQIITFGTLAPKACIRAVGKVMEIPYATCDKLAKMIPNELGISIEKALEMNPELLSLYEENEEIHNLIDICKKLEGLPRHTSMHAAGVVVYPDNAMNYIPLSKAKDGTITTQYNMVEVEELGLLKMDFLGLRTLTVIKNAVTMAEKNHNIKIDIDNIDYNDVKVLEMISSGDCNGVFQLESSGMQSFMKELKPQSLEDVIAGISLYRPGPMDFIPKYIAGKNDVANIVYPCKELKPILEATYGCIVYQEQVMQIVRDLAGYTWGQSDNIRRAMSKKKQYVIDAERKSFIYGDESRNIDGCVKRGIDENIANSIYDSMVDFAKYAFNKSHAAAYAVVALQTAWLKYYYPIEFTAALMTSVIDNSDKLIKYIMSAKTSNIKVLNPSINHSFGNFVCENGKIRFGLIGLKNTGKNVVNSIVKERETNGAFKSLPDFLERTYDLGLDKSTIISLCKAGAFDEFGYNRRTCQENISPILEAMKKELKSNMAGQISLFDMESIKVTSEKYQITLFPEFSKEELLADEKEIAGIYISGHPLEDYELYLNKRVTTTLANLIPQKNDDDDDVEIAYVGDYENIVVGGMIKSCNVKYTKSNKQMAFLTIEDLTGSIEIVIFPKQFELFKNILEDGNKIFVKGNLQVNEKGVSIISNDIKLFTNVSATIWVRVEKFTKEIESYLLNNTIYGNNKIVVYSSLEKKKHSLTHKIAIDGDTLRKLEDVYGKENVKLT